MKEVEITNEGRHHLLMISGHISCWMCTTISYRGIVVCVCGGWVGAGSVWYQVSNFPTVVEIIDLIPIPPSDCHK